MAERNDTVMVMCDGGLASLCALWAEAFAGRSPRQVIGWFDPAAGGLEAVDAGAHERALLAVRRQAQGCRGVEVIAAEAGAAGTNTTLRQTQMLLRAGAAALQENAGRIVWPLQLGLAAHLDAGEAEVLISAMSDAADRALLCSRLLAIESESLRGDGNMRADAGRFLIQTPYLELTDSQIVELALDLDIPLRDVHYATPQDERRWTRAIEEAGAGTLIRPAA